MKERLIKRVKFFIGLLLITTIIAIPHNLFRFDILSFFSIGGFLIIGLMVFHKWLRVFYTFLTVYCSLTPLLCLQYFWAKMELCPELWSVVLNTNLKEIRELVGPNFWILLFSTISLAIITWQICFRFLPKKIGLIKSTFIAGVGCLSIFICGVINTKTIEQGFWYYGFKKLQPLPTSWTLIYQIRQRRRMLSFDKEMDAYRFGMRQIRDKSFSNTVIVLVIGETARADHWSMNGYGRTTNPLLSKEKNGYFFDHVTSPASMTILSVPLIMTATSPENWIGHYSKKGIIDAFKEAGFYTAFITNQGDAIDNPYSARDLHMKYVDFFINVDTSDIVNPMLKSYDIRMLQPLANLFVQKRNKNLFVVLHLTGSHWKYADRYPKEFNVFNQNFPDVARNKYKYDKEIAEYDNSILYTDYILKKIIDELQKINGNSAMIYTSDHGENLKDDSRKLIYHSPDANKYTLHIPYYVWMNDSMKKQFPQYDSLLFKYKEYPLMSSEITMYTAFDFAGLVSEKEKECQKKNSLLSSDLRKSDQLFYTPLGNKLKYTDLQKN